MNRVSITGVCTRPQLDRICRESLPSKKIKNSDIKLGKLRFREFRWIRERIVVCENSKLKLPGEFVVMSFRKRIEPMTRPIRQQDWLSLDVKRRQALNRLRSRTCRLSFNSKSIHYIQKTAISASNATATSFWCPRHIVKRVKPATRSVFGFQNNSADTNLFEYQRGIQTGQTGTNDNDIGRFDTLSPSPSREEWRQRSCTKSSHNRSSIRDYGSSNCVCDFRHFLFLTTTLEQIRLFSHLQH